ncbi:MAG TPA: SpoVG family protein [Humisphaera sp.]|jgi:stage V sporulation protein G|nr:SpoVG family protein [Humisphaera sp.]
MQLTEVRINLCSQRGSRLKAFCSLTFDDTFVVRDVKLIDGNDGLFLAMPSRKLADHCPNCNDKNHLRARYCNNCGRRLNEERYQQYRNGNGHQRVKLHADIAHPISAGCRSEIEQRVLQEFAREVQRSKEPGYVPLPLDGEDFDSFDVPPRFDAPPRPLRAHPGHDTTVAVDHAAGHSRVASSPMA